MSHFIGLVFHDEDTNYEDLLAPYNEQDEHYFSFQDRTDEVREKWNSLPETDDYTYQNGEKRNCDKAHYPTIESLAEGWFGYDKNVEGKWGYKSNPNAKWDWYEEGGRWKGFIKTADDGDYEGDTIDSAPFAEIDWDYMLKDEHTPFCIVTAGGEWKEKGEMGWFAMTANEKPQDAWGKEVRNYVQTIINEGYADQVRVTAVDFHI